MISNISDSAKLNNGIDIPYLGFGLYLTEPGKEAQKAVHFALNAGYRHIDTAKFYNNENDVAKAIKESRISRENIFITTKLWNDDQGYERTFKAFEKSLKELETGYIDLYLLHWPVPGKRLESWKALEKLYKEGKIKSIGVSNFTIKHLKEFLDNCEIIPAVNQVEFSPYLYQKELLEFCNQNNIQLEAYSPLTRARKLNDKRLIQIAEAYSKTPAQILIRWALEHEVVVLPKSSHEARIKENADVFDFQISEDDMNTLDSMSENLRVAWDPTNLE